jgi:hypothetical protein
MAEGEVMAHGVVHTSHPHFGPTCKSDFGNRGVIPGHASNVHEKAETPILLVLY